MYTPGHDVAIWYAGCAIHMVAQLGGLPIAIGIGDVNGVGIAAGGVHFEGLYFDPRTPRDYVDIWR